MTPSCLRDAFHGLPPSKPYLSRPQDRMKWSSDHPSRYGKLEPQDDLILDSDLANFESPRPALPGEIRRDNTTLLEVHDGWVPDPIPNFSKTARPVVPDDYPPGDATLTFPSDNGKTLSICNLNLSVIAARSALIAMAFEETRSGSQLNLGALCPRTAMPFVRYLYSGSYAEFDFWEDVPTSLLLHCRMYYLGILYDLPELRSQAYVNILRQCEFGCSSPDKPIDLCAAIKFSFDNLRSSTEVTESILHYCVSCFLHHNLGEDPEFKSMAYELRPFHQDLMKVCRDRGYDDDSAAAIIQLPYKPYLPETYASTEHPAIAHFEDLICHNHGAEEKQSITDFPNKGKRPIGLVQKPLDMHPAPTEEGPSSSGPKFIFGQNSGHPAANTFKLTLPVRTRPLDVEVADGDKSASEDDGLCIGKKRKVPTVTEALGQSLLSGSSSDFELVARPANAVESLDEDSGNDSETGILVDVPGTENVSRRVNSALANIAPTSSNAAAASPELVDVFSESEWDML